jgi:hypothetical protein
MLSTAGGEAGARPAEAARAARFTSTTRHVSPQTEIYTLIKKKIKFSTYIRNGAVAKSYMRKGFLIFEEMRKYLVIYEEAVSQI